MIGWSESGAHFKRFYDTWWVGQITHATQAILLYLERHKRGINILNWNGIQFTISNRNLTNTFPQSSCFISILNERRFLLIVEKWCFSCSLSLAQKRPKIFCILFFFLELVIEVENQMNASIQITILWRDRPPEIKTPNRKDGRAFIDTWILLITFWCYHSNYKISQCYNSTFETSKLIATDLINWNDSWTVFIYLSKTMLIIW